MDVTTAWVKLARVTGLQGAFLQQALQECESLLELLELPDQALAALGANAKTRHSLHTAQAEAEDITWLEHEQHHLVPIEHPLYPPLLRRIADPPMVLWCVGDSEALVRPQIAMVGSRNASGSGCDNAFAFARHFAAAGLVVTSGLALGVDGAAHRGALKSGCTVAVMAAGPDSVYPREHQALARSIVGQGVLVSEYPPGTGIRRGQFPHRNRIISGMSLGVLVVEAGLRSGSLITARLATEQGRDVFALPGSIHNPMSKGCHRLIKQGAKLVETAAEVLEELGPMAAELGGLIQARMEPQEEVPSPAGALEPNERRLLELLEFDPITVDQLVLRSGLTVNDVSSMLLALELQGLVQADLGGRYSRR